VLPQARLAYVTLGELNAAKDNVVVCPTWFTATPSDTATYMTGPERAIDPGRYFIVVPNQLGGGVSSSPSNTPAPFEKGRFPHVTTYDNVAAQHRLLTEELGIKQVRLVSSWSMGASQTYAWGALHPNMVQALAPISGSARTGNFNKVFLAGNVLEFKDSSQHLDLIGVSWQDVDDRDCRGSWSGSSGGRSPSG
jgi:homoserine O-acetyltransferase